MPDEQPSEVSPTSASQTPPPAGYEFTEDQNKEIAAVTGAVWVVGMAVGLLGIKLTGRAISGGWFLATGTGRPMTGWQLAELVGLVVFLAPLAYWLLRASYSLARITPTAGRDIDHLMAAFRDIRATYSWIILPIMCALVVGLGLAVGRLAGFWPG